MKFQPKRFVVEVKRGTNRSAFTSPDAAAERFSGAEAALFGAAPKLDAGPAQPDAAKGEGPSRRILRSLVEPPAPIVEDEPLPARRGRKPGSKNKPKLVSLEPAPASDGERPRRGRKPGSKNKPKLQVPSTSPATQPAAAAMAATAAPAAPGRHDLMAAMRSYGFADEEAAWGAPGAPSPAPTAAEQQRIDPASSPPAAGRDVHPTSSRHRVRLRDRSSILKRYVLDIEPRPGQPGALRARRRSRAAP